MKHIIFKSLAIFAGLAMAAGLLWLFHRGYISVASYFFPDAPERFTRPDYWLFAGLWVSVAGLIGLINRLSSGKKQC